MSPLRNFLPTGTLVALAALALIFSTSACSESNFAGGSGNGSFGLNDGKEGKDGKGRDDGNDGGESDSDSDSDSGGGGGKDSGGDSDGGEGNGGEGGDSDGSEGGGGSGGDSDGDSDVDDGGGDTTIKKTRSDLTIRQTRSDDKHNITVELMIKGKSVQREEVAAPGKGKSVVLKNMCRRGLDTCLKVTFSGDVPRIAGKSDCTFVNKNKNGSTVDHGKTTVKLDVDTNGAGFLGSCRADEDETHFFECPESKSLKAANCTG